MQLNANAIRRVLRLSALCAVIAVASAGPVVAQEFELEGKISAFTAGDPLADTPDTLTVMGIEVDVTGLDVETPTGSITFSELAAAPSLIGATAIMTGEFDGVSNVADSLFVEIAENVMLGTVSAVSPTEVTVNGTGKIRVNSAGSDVGDTRFPALVFPAVQSNFTVLAETGYPMALPDPPGTPDADRKTTDCSTSGAVEAPAVPADSTKPCAITAGDLVVGEGDFRTNAFGESYLAAHTLEVGTSVLYDPALVPGNRDYVVVINAAVEGSELSLRGFATNPDTVVNVFEAEDDCSATGLAVARLSVGGDGRFRAEGIPFGDFPNVVVRTDNSFTGGSTYCAGVN